MQKSNDAMLNKMGIYDGKLFKLQELNGTFIYNKEKRVISEIKGGCRPYVVSGLYQNLLRGVYHVK